MSRAGFVWQTAASGVDAFHSSSLISLTKWAAAEGCVWCTAKGVPKQAELFEAGDKSMKSQLPRCCCWTWRQPVFIQRLAA